MSPFFIGLSAAILSMLGWGSYFVPMKRAKTYEPFYFQAIMGAGILLSSTIVTIFYNTLTFSFYGFLSGVLWTLGNVTAAFAVKHTGLSKAAPVWMGTGIIISIIWGLLFFKEPISQLALAFIGTIFLLIGIVAISKTGSDKQTANTKGILYSVVAGIIFGSYLVPFKLIQTTPMLFLFPMALGILTAGITGYLFKQSKPVTNIVIPSLFSGVIWNIANVASFFAVANLGLAIAFPLTQLALFVSILWGILYFHEIKGKENIQKILIGAAILFIGAILLTVSK